MRQQHKYQELKVAVVKASESLTKDAMNQLLMSAMDFSQNDWMNMILFGVCATTFEICVSCPWICLNT